VVPLIVDAFIAVLKVAVTDALVATPVAPFVGVAAVTVGALNGGVFLPPLPPHPASARTATSHQDVRNRITHISLSIIQTVDRLI